MRRFIAVAGAVLLLTQLPMVPVAPASPARGTIRVITIGRDGRATSAEVHLVSLVTNNDFYFPSGREKRLPRGSYELFVDIITDSDETDTLAAKRITVAARTRQTIRARRGQPVRVRLRPAPPRDYDHSLTSSLCTPDGFSASFETSGGHGLYVIPSARARAGVAIASVWQPEDLGAGRPAFLGTVLYRHGLPDGATGMVRRSSLATIHVNARSGTQTGVPRIELLGSTTPECREVVMRLTAQVELPYSFDAHVSAGTWELDEDAQDAVFDRPQQYRAGHVYGLTINRAVWGPAGGLPMVRGGAHVLDLERGQMFADPTLPYGAAAKTRYKLTKGGRTIIDRTGGGIPLQPVLPSRGWYTLRESAKRTPNRPFPAAPLATRSSFRLRFYADPNLSRHVRGYLTEFRPAGLDRYDAAEPGTATVVELHPHGKHDDARKTTQPNSVKTIEAWYSTNYGTSWHLLHVQHAGGRWSAKVPNEKPGYISLRARITDTHHGYCTTTVIRAYSVGPTHG